MVQARGVLSGRQRRNSSDCDSIECLVLQRLRPLFAFILDEVGFETERQPRAVDAGSRPLELQVLAHLERQLRTRRAFDRGSADLAVALRRMPVAGGEQRTVDRNR
jgi:hypothetical protein